MAHNSTLFTQILSLIPRHVFHSLERKHQTGRSSRQFGFKEQFAVMAFIHLAARSSLRDGFTQRLHHWGLTKVAQTTICDANRHRPVEFFLVFSLKCTRYARLRRQDIYFGESQLDEDLLPVLEEGLRVVVKI